MTIERNEIGLVLGGGGARGAYQVGYLRRLAQAFPEFAPPIMTGVSAGAINALFLASHPAPLGQSTCDLSGLWEDLTVERVFRTDFGGFASNVLRWALRLVMGGSRAAPRTRGMVDTTPLRESLERGFALHGAGLGGIRANLSADRLRAVAVTTSSYNTGSSVTWVQSQDRSLANWRRPHRRAVPAELTIDHALASSALPLFFPAVRIGDEWHGDGGVRLTTPLAPALHLGADKILAVSTRHRATSSKGSMIDGYPPPAQVLGVLMNAVFLDNLDQDALILERINRLVAGSSAAVREGLRPVRLLLTRPSIDLGELASRYEAELKGLFRWLTRSAGTRETRSPDALSMLLFLPEYIDDLIALGEADAEHSLGDIERFLAAPVETLGRSSAHPPGPPGPPELPESPPAEP